MAWTGLQHGLVGTSSEVWGFVSGPRVQGRMTWMLYGLVPRAFIGKDLGGREEHGEEQRAEEVIVKTIRHAVTAHQFGDGHAIVPAHYNFHNTDFHSPSLQLRYEKRKASRVSIGGRSARRMQSNEMRKLHMG